MGFKSINSVFLSPQCDSHCCPSWTRSVIRHFREGGGGNKQTNKKQFTKATEAHLVSSYSDTYTETIKGWDSFIFHSSLLTDPFVYERMKGKGEEGRGEKWFYSVRMMRYCHTGSGTA